MDFPVNVRAHRLFRSYREPETEVSAAGGLGLERRLGSRPPSVNQTQRANTKWSTRFCCQHCSLSWLQNGFSLPRLTVVMRSAEIPCCTSACLADSARLVPRARLYSSDPRSSQCPSMTTLTFGCWERNALLFCVVGISSERTSALL